ncbi:MAG: hypothetical protein ACOY0T_04340 [Myxococcota bacterium]
MTNAGSWFADKPRLRFALYALPLAVAATALGLTLRHREWNEPFFVASVYYSLFALVAIYVGVQLSLARASLRSWFWENWPGVVTTLVLLTIVLAAVPASMRVLADEANLVGVSKNLFFTHNANFSVAGKWYFENYWDISLATDRRPALFPFLVSLLHLVKGYRVENAFTLNALVFLALVWSSYRFAKSIGGEVFGVCAAVLVGANPNTLVAVRSAGFDALATLFLLIAIKSFAEFLRDRTPARLALYALTLCLVAHVRYEGWALLLIGVVVPAALRLIKRELLVGYGWLYACVPLFLLPRYWQTIAKAGDAEQPLSASLFSLGNFVRNGREYLSILRHPFDVDGPHSPLLLPLALLGTIAVAAFVVKGVRERSFDWQLQLAALVLGILGFETVLSFSYDWGRPLHAASCRLFIWLDTYVTFAAAWCLTLLGRHCPVDIAWLAQRSTAPIAVIASSVLFAVHAPAAVAARFTNSLILTREAAQEWRYFERLADKRILILCDRPGLFTIMDYGANHISIAQTDRGPLYELSRKLYQDIYLIQEMDLDTLQPKPGFDVWTDVPLDVVEEFQNTDASFVRISRVRKGALTK